VNSIRCCGREGKRKEGRVVAVNKAVRFDGDDAVTGDTA
jgi:hypothetical protein